ncbi:Fic family protein [Domibacillus sp.]|uniref:Fic/DOC family protein n=1 Tax=Domibacillus sp. TaxID=1969783 RepID=UPI00281269C9|nr:Fic family protein [Domibacillus sp.]
MGKYFDGLNDEYLLQNNVIGARTLEELSSAEAFAFTVRAAQMERGGFVLKHFTEEEFKQLHHFLFQDVYPFAGVYRNVNISKGTTVFCHASYLGSMAAHLFNELTNDSLQGLTTVQAAKRLAYYKAELNMLHPFREGNGRTTRIFLFHYAKRFGFEWAYEKLDYDEYMQAMIQSVTDPSGLEAIFGKTLARLK